MKLRPGSFLWLVRHDLRLSWRRFSGHFAGRSFVKVVFIIALGVAFMHLICGPSAAIFARKDIDTQQQILGGGILFILLWQISQAISHFTRLLYSRSDFDLLLSSPMSPRAVVGAHALATVMEISLVVGAFVFPMANMITWRKGLAWLSIYPVALASSLLAAACGLAITVGLFKLLGPRRTRMAAQITAALLASALILGGQLAYLLSSPARPAAALIRGLPSAPDFMDWLILAPVRGVTGDIFSLALWVSFGCIAFALAIIRLGPGFLKSAVKSGGLATQQIKTREKRERPFRPGASAALRRKELKLLGRDPWLFSRALLQALYLAPVCIVIWITREDASLSLLVAPLLIMILSHLAGIMAWLTVLSEDAPDFIVTAPVTRDQILRSKLEAIALPLGLILLGPALGLCWLEPWDALLTVLFAIAACASTALINIWHPAPGKRENSTSRHNAPKIVSLKENVLAVCWAVACGAAITAEIYWSYFAISALFFVWINRPRPLLPAEQLRPTAA
jgi:ABC-2 type transport system permease protein